MYYPIALNIEQKKIVIVGGGVIATQKLRTLQGYGAHVTLISPTITDEANTLLQSLNGVWQERGFDPADVEGAFIVFVATNNKEVNEAVSAAVNDQQLILRADDVSKGNMLNQAVVRRGALSIAVCTDGASPSLTRKLKQRFEQQFPKSYDAYVSFLAQARQHVLANVPRDKSRALLGLLVDEELEQYVAQGELQRAWATVHAWVDEANA